MTLNCIYYPSRCLFTGDSGRRIGNNHFDSPCDEGDFPTSLHLVGGFLSRLWFPKAIPRYPHSVSHSYPYLTEEGAHFHLMMVVFPIVYPIPIGFPNLHMAQESIEGPQLLLQLFRVLLRNTLEEPPCQTPRQTIEKWEDDSWYDMGSSEKYICWLVISFVWYMIYYIYRYFIPTNGMTINKLTYSKCPIFCGAFYWSAFEPVVGVLLRVERWCPTHVGRSWISRWLKLETPHIYEFYVIAPWSTGGATGNGSFSGSFILGLEFGVVDFQPKSVFLRVYRRLVMKSYLVKLLHVEPCGLSDEHDWLLLVQATLKWKLPAPWFLLKLWFTWLMVVSDWYHLLTGQNWLEECVVIRWFPIGKSFLGWWLW